MACEHRNQLVYTVCHYQGGVSTYGHVQVLPALD